MKRQHYASTRKRLDRDLRKGLVYSAAVEFDGPVSIEQLATALGMVRSPYLLALIGELVDNGMLEWVAVRAQSGHVILALQTCELTPEA